MSAKHATPAARKPYGFTLIELLVVIAIIALLISMLLPTFARAKLLAQNTRAHGRLAELGNACIAYQRETGFYPGQADQSSLVGNHGLSGDTCGRGGNDTSGHFTGSQYLGLILFGQGVYDTTINKVRFDYPATTMNGEFAAYQQRDILNDDKPLDGKYRSTANAQINVSVANHPTQSVSPLAGFISDRMNSPMPFLYFPSRPGITGPNQYKSNDNTSLTTASPDKFDPYVAGFSPMRSGTPIQQDRAKWAAAGKTTLYEQWTFYGADPNASPKPDLTDQQYFPPRVVDPRLTTGVYPTFTMTPRNPNGFILIGAGMDRQFFTDDDLIFPAWK